MNSRGRGAANAEAQFDKWLREHAPESATALLSVAEDMVVEGIDRDDPVLDIIVNGAAVKTAKALDRPHIVDERPWMARKGGPKANGGVTYQSEAVLQRHWSDHTTDYTCAFPGCLYENTNPRGVATHYGHKHTMKGEKPASQDGPVAIDPTYTEPSKATYTPTDRLLLAFIDAIDAAMENGTDQVDVARLLLTWLHERPDLEHFTREQAPLTDRDILNRIRLLVHQPDQSERIAQLTLERDEANAHLLKVQRDLDSITDMLKEVGR
jgi:hypothetical protein